MLDGEHASRASHARLHFVRDEKDAVLLRDRPEPLHELVGRDDIAPLALDGLDDNGRHLLRGYQMKEEPLLQEVQARGRRRRRAERRTIDVRVGGVIDARHQRAESAPLARLARRERQRAERAAVEPAQKRDDVGPLRRVARELEARLDRFRAGVAEERPHAAVDGSHRGDLLGEPHLRLVVEVGAGHVQKLLRLIGDRLHDRRMGVAGGAHRNAGRAVEEDVAVDVLDHRGRSALHHERVAPRVRGRYGEGVALDERLGLWTGERGLDMRTSHDAADAACLKTRATFSSTGCRTRCLRAGCPAPPGRRGRGRPRRSRGGAARRGDPRSAARSRPPAPAADRPPPGAG